MNKPNVWIGCWAQPPENFSVWKDDGVNLVIGPDAGNPVRFTQMQLHQKCKDLGLWYIDVPKSLPDLDRMIGDPSCLAIGLPDEPDLNAPKNNPNPVTEPQLVGAFQKYVDDWAAKNAWIINGALGKKRFYINFAGPKVLGGTTSGYSGQIQSPFVIRIPTTNSLEKNILSCDYYPMNQNAGRYSTTFPGDCAKFMKQWWPGFEIWQYLECSDQVLDNTEVAGDPKNIGRGPTPAEMEAELSGVLAQNVGGISWFSHKFHGQPWQPDLPVDAWDGRTAEQRLKCKEIAVRLNGAITQPNPLDDLQKQMDQMKLDISELKANALRTNDRVILSR